MTDTITYIDGSSQIASITSSAAQCSISFLYTYDDNGNILTVSDGTNTTRYQYDSQNQLIREDNQAYGFTYVWTYDNAGNIRSRVEFAYTTAQTPGNPGKVVSYQYSNGDWGDLLTGRTQMANGVTSTVSSYTYDEIGNPLSDGTWTYTWKHGRELASMTNGSTTWAYTYDANGMRTKRTNGSTTYEYTYNGGLLTKLVKNGVTMYFVYDAVGQPYAMIYNGYVLYYILNQQGDVIRLVDYRGISYGMYNYDAWGNLTFCSTNEYAQNNPLRYRGYVYDNETKLYYLQSRYYNPEVRRFLNADVLVSTGQGTIGNNMFAYCLNNPVLYYDPDGYETMVYDDRTDGDSLDGLLDAGGGGASKAGTGKGATCFVVGTLIHTDEGLVAIEDIEVGTYVWAWDESTGELDLKPVLDTYKNSTNELVHVFVNGEEIITTPTHPFYSPVKGWIEACRLRAGDILVLVNGEYVVVEKVQHEILESPIAVYNFNVDGYHTYYVSRSGILVHNSCNHGYAWAKQRTHHWKEASKTAEQDKNYGAYIATDDNIDRMSDGKAPIGWDGKSVQLHHWDGIATNFYNYSPVSYTLHRLIHRHTKL